MPIMKIKDVCEINPAKTIDLEPESLVSFVPMKDVHEDGSTDITETIEVSKVKNYSVFRNGDVLFAKITPCMENGKGAIVEDLFNGYGAGSTEFIVLRPNNALISKEWLQLFLSQKSFRAECQAHMTGSAGQKRVPPKYLGNCAIPVPSLEVQHQIVSQIEELFSDLDDGVDTLEKMKKELELYRQTVLKSAFTGIAGEHTIIKNICKDIKVGIVIKPAQYYTDKIHGTGAFRSANVREFHVEDQDWVYLNEKGMNENQRSVVHTGDVLIVRSGYPGTACVVPREYDGYNAIDILIAVPDQAKVLPEFLCAYTNSPLGKQFVAKEKRGVGQKHFNVGGYSKMKIVLPTVQEQQAIVSEIESRLSVCDEISSSIDTALQQAASLRQSILKKAFEGELVHE